MLYLANAKLLVSIILVSLFVGSCSLPELPEPSAGQKAIAAQYSQKLRACNTSCSRNLAPCQMQISTLIRRKASRARVSQQINICEGQKRQCVNACSAESQKAMNRAFRIKAEEEKRRSQVARRDDNAGIGGRANLDHATGAPVKRWDNTGGPKTWLTAQSPLWPCRELKRWKNYTCVSDANTQGRKFKITMGFERYVKPKKSFSKELTDALTPSLNPFDWAKKVAGACKPVKTPGGMVGAKGDGGMKLLNIGLMGCGALGSMFGGGKKNVRIFQGVFTVKLDGEAIHKCPQFITGYYTKGTSVPKYNLRHVGCFRQVLVNPEKRDALFVRTGIRPDNKFGPAGSFSILAGCANKSDWAAYGRDASSEEVAFCKTRKTFQDGKAYQLEARQLNLKDGNQWIKITIGRQVDGQLDPDANTRIRQVVMDYKCGNKSFARMRKNPRGTAAACIKDMLALIRKPRSNLDAFVQNQADKMERLGGYGYTPGR